MSKEIEKSTFLVKSKENNSFGTAFCIYKDKKGSYLLTCAHVVNTCNTESLVVSSYNNENLKTNVTVKFISKNDDLIDLAVLYVEGLVESEALILSDEEVTEHDIFTINGFRVHKTGQYAQEPLLGSIKKKYPIVSAFNKKILIYDLQMSNGDSIEKGYSGSAIIMNNKVVAVATDRNISGKQAYAIPIKYLKKIWEDMPNMPNMLFFKEKTKNDILRISDNEVVDKEEQYAVNVSNVDIIKDNKKLGIITIKTVLLQVEGKILNVSIYPVTFEEYDLFCEDKAIDKPNAYNWGRKNRPVIDVSWYDAIEYCTWLGEKSNKSYRLLISEEWIDIAKRDIPNKKFKKYIVHSKSKTEKVGTKKVGQLGLYDFVGNIYEWCDKRETEKAVRGLLFSDKVTSYQNLFNEILLQPTTSNFKIGFRIVEETF